MTQDATALAAAIAGGEISPAAAMAAAYARADKVPGAVARALPLDEAIAAAERAAATGGVFAGVPFLGKDLGAAARGLATTGGAAAVRARMSDPEADDDLFARFRAGGLVPFGLSTTAEFGMALSAEPPGMMPAFNPFAPLLSAGGSSGGAALAVAEGVVAIAHATDAAGSIRVPAACCGLWGLKPSRGAVPQGPGYGNHLMGIAAELVLARSLRDVAAACDLVCGGAEAAPRPLRIALRIPDRCDDRARMAVIIAAEALEAAGHEIVIGDARDDLGARAHRIAGAVCCLSLADWLAALEIPDDELSPLARAVRMRGEAMPGREAYALTREIARLTDEADALFEEADAMLAPVLAAGPPPLGAFPNDETDIDARLARMEAIAPNAALANVAGLPALALPAGMSDGLPVGVQLIGPQGADAMLLALAEPLADLAAVPFPPIAGMP